MTTSRYNRPTFVPITQGVKKGTNPFPKLKMSRDKVYTTRTVLLAFLFFNGVKSIRCLWSRTAWFLVVCREKPEKPHQLFRPMWVVGTLCGIEMNHGFFICHFVKYLPDSALFVSHKCSLMMTSSKAMTTSSTVDVLAYEQASFRLSAFEHTCTRGT